MRKRIFVFIFLLICCPLRAAEFTIDLNLQDLHLKKYAFSSDVSENERIVISANGKARSYFLYVPKITSHSMPVLIALHGAGRSGSSMVHTWRRNADKHGFMVVAPNGINNNWDLNQDDWFFIQSVVGDALKRARVSAQKMYLFGHSNGAVKAIALAATHPEKFAAAAVHGGTLPRFNPTALPRGTQAIPPVAIFLGDKDHIFSLDSARETARWLSRNGFSASLYVLEKHSHWYYEDFDRINESIWAFLSRR